MLRIAFICFCAALAIWGGTITSASAGAYDFLRDDYIAEGANHYEALEEARATLEASSPETWTNLEIQVYLSEALWTVYCGLLAHSFDKDSLPSAVNEAALQGYMSGWPGNPFNNWEPIQVLSISEVFSPGELVLQVCPREYWSIGGPIVKHERAMSFELSINGPTPVYAALGNAEPSELNDWAAIPEGAVYMLGSFCESAEMTREKRGQR